MPIVRFNEDGKLVAELRQWGFIMMINGKSIDANGKPKKVRRDVFNAMSEKLTSSFTWKWSFKERRCLIPMSSWDEWRETGAGKQRVRVSMPAEPVFMAAGLYDANVDPKTGEKVDVYTMCTVPPNEFLGTVHDRAPMVLLPSQYDAWLEGSAAALSLVGVHPDADVFDVMPVQAPQPLPAEGLTARPVSWDDKRVTSDARASQMTGRPVIAITSRTSCMPCKRSDRSATGRNRSVDLSVAGSSPVHSTQSSTLPRCIGFRVKGRAKPNDRNHMQS